MRPADRSPNGASPAERSARPREARKTVFFVAFCVLALTSCNDRATQTIARAQYTHITTSNQNEDQDQCPKSFWSTRFTATDSSGSKVTGIACWNEAGSGTVMVLGRGR